MHDPPLLTLRIVRGPNLGKWSWEVRTTNGQWIGEGHGYADRSAAMRAARRKAVRVGGIIKGYVGD